MQRVAVFDFDDTIIHGDSVVDMLWQAHRQGKASLWQVLYAAGAGVLYHAGIIPAIASKRSAHAFLKNLGPDEREAFLRAKRVMYAKAVKSFDSTRTVSEMLLDYVMTGYELFRYVDLYEEIEAEDVEALLREAFNEEYFALSVIRPTDESRFG